MLRLTAGQFLAFALTPSAQGKAKFVRDAIEHAQMPNYDPPPDYWFRLRTALISMISRGQYTEARGRAALSKVPMPRRETFARILHGFLAYWPRQQPQTRIRPRLTHQLEGLTISCQPHAAVVVDGRLRYLRFLYPINASLGRKQAAEYEILRRATGLRALPGLLHVASGRIVVPRVGSDIGAFLHAEATEYARLWRLYGGPPTPSS